MKFNNNVMNKIETPKGRRRTGEKVRKDMEKTKKKKEKKKRNKRQQLLTKENKPMSRQNKQTNKQTLNASSRRHSRENLQKSQISCAVEHAIFQFTDAI